MDEISMQKYPYLQELSDVPKAIESSCYDAKNKNEPIFKEISRVILEKRELFLFGMASSQWASLPMYYILKGNGVITHWYSAYDGIAMARLGLLDDKLVIMVSQSGQTIEIIRMLEELSGRQKKPKIIAFTNNLNSHLADQSNFVFDLKAGNEVCAPTKTYINTIVTLLFLCSHILQRDQKIFKPDDLFDDIMLICALIKEYQKKCECWGKEVAINIFESNSILFLAQKLSMASAYQASMLCSEITRINGSPNSWATFRHGFEPQVKNGFQSIGFEPFSLSDPVWERTKTDIEVRKGRVFLVPILENTIDKNKLISCYSMEEILAPIWETIPIHWLLIELARKKSMDPSVIERKITLSM